MVAVNEHVRALERAIKTTGDEPAETTYASPAPSPVDVEEVLAAPAQANEPPAADPAEDFISNSAAEVFGSASDADNDTDVSFIDIPGFEKERRFFAEDAPADRGRAPDDRFVVDNTQERRWDLADAPAEEETAAAAPATPAPQAGPDSDGFLTGPRPVVSPRTIERPEPAMERRSTSRAEVELSAATATIDPDADAIDLYELGAIDCVQTV